MDVRVCSRCSFQCICRLQLIKHCFESHSYEPTFRVECGIRGCCHVFTFGATYSSFKTHASRKHPGWKENVNDRDTSSSAADEHMSTSETFLLDDIYTQRSICAADTPDELMSEPVDSGLPKRAITATETAEPVAFQPQGTQLTPSRERTAALFLLTFKEKYRLSQTAINFAVGSINTIVDDVCQSVEYSVQRALEQDGCTSEISPYFSNHDPFANLQTDYQQAKFYRDEFGLVVSL